MIAILAQREMQEKLAALGLDTVGNSPEEFRQLIRLEVAKWTKLVKQAGIKVE